MVPRIFLFDIDGVLLQPNGYRMAVIETLKYFCGKIGGPEILPGKHEFSLFEALGITCEWDQVPICLAILFEEIAAVNHTVLPAKSLAEGFAWAKNMPPVTVVDYEAAIVRLKPFLQDGVAVVEAIFDHWSGGDCDGLFNHLPAELLKDLFINTRNVPQSWTTQVFQNHVLGSADFESIYRVPAPVDVNSYLRQYDRPLLLQEDRENLLEECANYRLHAAAYTARYSLPPMSCAGVCSQYSPEAELGLQVVGLEKLPLVAYGSLNYLAEQVGFTGERLLKPVPVQALAAVATAWGNPVWDALRWGYGMVAGNDGYEDLPFFDSGVSHLPRGMPAVFDLHVFEDSPIGIRACAAAVEWLQKHKIQATLHAWGIASHPAKIKALEDVGGCVFPDIHTALRQVL